jgi:hypothetical protein
MTTELLLARLKPVYVKYFPVEKKFGEIYISEGYESSVHLCPCGCENNIVLPFSGNDGWKFRKSEDGSKVTFSPSIGNFHLNCKSHYFIQENKVVEA